MARRIGVALRLARLARRNRGAFTAAALATLLVLVLAIALSRQVTDERREPSPDADWFLDDVFDLSVHACSTGAVLDLVALPVGREHLRGPALRMLVASMWMAMARPDFVIGVTAPPGFERVVPVRNLR